MEQRPKILYPATQEVERANRVQRELLARTSHELRTPLNAGQSSLTSIDEGLDLSEGGLKNGSRLGSQGFPRGENSTLLPPNPALSELYHSRE